MVQVYFMRRLVSILFIFHAIIMLPKLRQGVLKWIMNAQSKKTHEGNTVEWMNPYHQAAVKKNLRPCATLKCDSYLFTINLHATADESYRYELLLDRRVFAESCTRDVVRVNIIIGVKRIIALDIMMTLIFGKWPKIVQSKP